MIHNHNILGLFSGERSVKEFETFMEVDEQIGTEIENSEIGFQRFRKSDSTDGRGRRKVSDSNDRR